MQRICCPLMALTIANNGGGTAILYGNSTRNPQTQPPIRRHVLFPLSRRTLHVVSAKKFSPRSGRFDSKNRKSNTTTRDQDQYPNELKRTGAEFEFDRIESGGVDNVSAPVADDGYFLPELPGDKPDFWEGPQWDAFGFFVEYLWAFGIVFAVIFVLHFLQLSTHFSVWYFGFSASLLVVHHFIYLFVGINRMLWNYRVISK